MLQLDLLTVDVKICLVDSNQSYSPLVFGNIRSYCIDILELYVLDVSSELARCRYERLSQPTVNRCSIMIF